jgi:DNA mismatch repair protein MutH
MKLPYNPEDKKSIIDFAKKLKDKTLRQVIDIETIKNDRKGKGHFGQIIEEFYFHYKPNSNSEPDFPVAGLELKSSPLKRLINNEYRAKERLVLNIINYINVVNQNFENSDFLKKNANILLVFYLNQAGYDILDFIIKLVDEWNFPSTDLEIIKKDWETITKKIADGKAHELSEGDTFYLGACTKGANASSVRKQPFSEIPAKQRAYSLKQGYVNHIIASIANDSTEIYGKIINSVADIKNKTIEEIVINKFKPYYGKNVDEISKKTGVALNLYDTKNFYSKVTRAILNVELTKEIEEFEKANIVIKAIRVESNNNIIQSISFPAFEFEKIYLENWITSEMKEIVEKKFLFIFFKNDGTSYILEKVRFWNMPLIHRNEVRKVWLKTKKVIQEGRIFNSYAKDKFGNFKISKKGNLIKKNNLPKMNDNPVCHVRPHGSDSNETFILPVEDKLLKTKEYSKQCFWLKNTYVRDEIYLKN